MRGPKPRPTQLKILAGARPCRINADEPVMPAADGDPPEWLDKRGREHWLELAPILIGAGMLKSGDRPALAELCDEFSRIRKDPADSKARDRYRRLLVEFGLTPSSRSRIKGTTAAPRDDLAEFLAGKRKA